MDKFLIVASRTLKFANSIIVMASPFAGGRLNVTVNSWRGPSPGDLTSSTWHRFARCTFSGPFGGPESTVTWDKEYFVKILHSGTFLVVSACECQLTTLRIWSPSFMSRSFRLS